VKTFSDPTVGKLVELGIVARKSELTLLLMKSDLAKYEPPALSGMDPNKTDMLMGYLRAANRAADHGDETAHKGLLEFARQLVIEMQPLIGVVRKLVDSLGEALLADGYELTESTSGSMVLLPTEPSAAPLPPEITALDAELDKRGYDVALNHYRQASTTCSTRTTKQPTAPFAPRWKNWSPGSP